MLKVLSRRETGPIGLDVGSESIRALQLCHSAGKLWVAAAARWQLPHNGSGPGADAPGRTSLAVQAVRDMLKRGKFRGRDVVSCLRGEELDVRNVRLPQMPDHELNKAILWECQERFGFPVAPDRMHYINAGEVRQGAEVRDEILIMAVPEETVRGHLDMLEKMHLRPVHMDAEPAALFRAYLRNLRRVEDESTVTVIVDIGLASTKVIVARGRTILLIKSFDVAGRALNQSVAAELGLSYSEAAHLRRSSFEHGADAEEPSPPADQVEWSVIDAIRGQVESLAQEVALCLRYCSVTFRGLRPTQVTLAGGEAYDPALVRLLGECLDFPCVVGQPLHGIELGDIDMGGDRRAAHTEWSVATGLALRELTATRDLRGSDYARSGLSA